MKISYSGERRIQSVLSGNTLYEPRTKIPPKPTRNKAKTKDGKKMREKQRGEEGDEAHWVDKEQQGIVDQHKDREMGDGKDNRME
ncbi:hypothetical protein AG1IA_05788 [Rhizoctonia solani AG-1 IA]|uniref:Uncharacterized protein n=1 Tax=Thanatephorus cucumeris (strain AG1-IA) TaxID=983506 RepID=L8WPV5_THACA|nr:hypothetical protein AG1IA_05788 [Rhizoctonia solani AG-1 IA]